MAINSWQCWTNVLEINCKALKGSSSNSNAIQCVRAANTHLKLSDDAPQVPVFLFLLKVAKPKDTLDKKLADNT